MTGIVVTDSASLINVEFNDYSSVAGISSGAWRKSEIVHVGIIVGTSCCEIGLSTGEKWVVSHDGSDSMKVESINGIQPVSSSDLLEKLKAIL